MVELRISPSARNDLRDIYNYILFDLKSEQSARKRLDDLFQAIETLTVFPEGHRLARNRENFVSYFHLPDTLRVYSFRGHDIWYVYQEDEQLVEVVRITNQRQDIGNIKF